MKRAHWVAPLVVGVLLLLTGCATPASDATATTAPAATPTATVDVPSQAYLTLLHTYYLPWVLAHHQQRDTCGPDFNALPASDKAKQLPACRPLLVTEIAAGMTLIAQLASAQPPARWQTAHEGLKQAMQGAAAWDGQRLAAIDAHDVPHFVALSYGAPQVLTVFCEPIRTINAGPPVTNLPVPDFAC